MIALVALLIFAVSAVFAMLGLGGGMLYVPIFHWLGFGLTSLVIPLGLLLNGLNTLIALIPYGRKGLVDWTGGLPMALVALLFAPLGAMLAPRLPARLLLLLFAAAVFAAAVRTLLTAGQPEPAQPAPTARRALVGTLVAALAGFAGGLLGIGGGFIIGPLLMWAGYETKRAAATTAYVVTFSSFSGFLGHAGHMTVDLPLLLVAVGAVVLASLLGSWFMANRAKPAWVRWFYGLLLLAVAVRLVV
jgi:uncharacterized membrane protein YfcA